MGHPLAQHVRERLRDAVARDGRAPRRISLAAGVGAGAIADFLNERQSDITIGALASLADALRLPVSALLVRDGFTPDPFDPSAWAAVASSLEAAA